MSAKLPWSPLSAACATGAEPSQNITRGQTVAVVFSDELAMAHSPLLAAVAELEEQHKHYVRTTKLAEIGAASCEELEQTTT